MNKAPFLLILLYLTCAASLLWSQATYARQQQIIPAPITSPLKPQTLQEVESQISAEQQRSTNLEKQKQHIEKQVKKIQTELVIVAKKIQKNENEIIRLENRLKLHEAEKNDLNDKIASSKKNIVQLILVIEKLEKIPFIALAAQPGAALETAQNALILANLGKSLKIRSSNLKKNTERVQTIITNLQHDKKTLQKTKQAFKNDQSILKRQAKLKKTLLARSQKDIKLQKIKIKKIVSKANTLKDLIKSVKTQPQQKNSLEKIKSILPKFKSAKMGMPVAGNISVRYGKRDHLNAISKGLWISSRDQALVTSPYDGEIKFIGEFKSYGNIIIIEHKNGYHSLIAGLDNISINIGDNVITGEPIGHLEKSKTPTKAAQLYFELRKSGKAIDPEEKLSNL